MIRNVSLKSMKHNAYWTCDLGGEIHETAHSVRNDVTIIDGEHSRIYNDVCDRCIKKLVDAIDLTFRRNKYSKVKVKVVKKK